MSGGRGRESDGGFSGVCHVFDIVFCFAPFAIRREVSIIVVGEKSQKLPSYRGRYRRLVCFSRNKILVSPNTDAKEASFLVVLVQFNCTLEELPESVGGQICL